MSSLGEELSKVLQQIRDDLVTRWERHEIKQQAEQGKTTKAILTIAESLSEVQVAGSQTRTLSNVGDTVTVYQRDGVAAFLLVPRSGADLVNLQIQTDIISFQFPAKSTTAGVVPCGLPGMAVSIIATAAPITVTIVPLTERMMLAYQNITPRATAYVGTGGSTSDPLYAELTGSLAPHTRKGPTLVATIPYTSLQEASTTLQFQFNKVLTPNAIARDWAIANTTNGSTPSCAIYLGDSTLGFPGYTASGNGATNLAVGGGGLSWFNGASQSNLAMRLDSMQILVSTGATLATSGNLEFYVSELI